MVSFYALGVTSLVGFTACMWMYVKIKTQKYEILKQTSPYKEALAALRGHKGAIKFLGEPIEDQTVLVPSIKDINNEIRQTEINVELKGSIKRGMLYFWVNQQLDNPENVNLGDIQLQIGSDESKRLVIKNKQNELKNKNVKTSSDEI